MKILHFADTHIGVETYGSPDPESGLSTRVLDELKALDTVVDYAIDNKVDLVLFCGDAYKNREPSQTHQREFARRISRLSGAAIPTVIVVGNHDIPGSTGKANSVEIFETLDIEHIHIANRPGVLNITTPSGEVQVAVFPWLRRNALLVREDIKNLSVDEVTEKLQEAMTAKLMELAGQIDAGRPALLAGHFGIASASIGSERMMVIGRDPVVMLSDVASPVYDYIALGHIHKRQVLCEEPPVIYAGSLERLDFGDEGEEKGFYCVEITRQKGKKSVSYELHKIDARRFLTLEVKIAEDDADATVSILRKIEERNSEIAGAIVRLKISLPASLAGLVREGEIFKALKEAYNVSIGKEVRQAARARATGWISEGLAPLDALKNYLETKNYTEAYRKKLLEYGEKLINEKLAADRGDYAV
ncbi:MAG: exonuclease SbcCD subunit D [Dehalococcoidia bacterium]|nr:exonuclease SbcCD subunit D [Dehalococcoidia bacterium]MDD5495068.1 exonuclease SbcCD subunit D [Dehalococcoidia bacterium]